MAITAPRPEEKRAPAPLDPDWAVLTHEPGEPKSKDPKPPLDLVTGMWDGVVASHGEALQQSDSYKHRPEYLQRGPLLSTLFEYAMRRRRAARGPGEDVTPAPPLIREVRTMGLIDRAREAENRSAAGS